MANLDGILLVNKPLGITSHDVVQKVRRLANMRQVGHCGTLDPLAEGLLVLCLGRATKIARYLTDSDKAYSATIGLGTSTDTYDRESLSDDFLPQALTDITEEKLQESLTAFTGTIQQQVPSFSAARVGGRRLHAMARAGETVEAPVKTVTIHDIDLLSFENPSLTIHVECSSGTYIRSIAHDMGQMLGCGAYLEALQRTASGRFRLDKTATLETIKSFCDQGLLPERLVSISEALGFGAIIVDDSFAAAVVNGLDLRADHITALEGEFGSGDSVLLKDQRGRALAVGKAELSSHAMLSEAERPVFRYSRVLN